MDIFFKMVMKIGFYWFLLGFTGFYWVLLGFTGFYRVLRVFKALSGFLIASLNTTFHFLVSEWIDLK